MPRPQRDGEDHLHYTAAVTSRGGGKRPRQSRDTGSHDTGNHDTGNHDTGNRDTGNHDTEDLRHNIWVVFVV